MMRGWFCVLLLLWAAPVSAQSTPPEPPPPDRVLRTGYLTLAAFTAADMELTGRALELGLVERNPVYRWVSDVPGGVGLLNGALSGAVGIGVHKLHTRGHRTAARWILWGATAAKIGVVAWNAQQVRQRRR